MSNIQKLERLANRKGFELSYDDGDKVYYLTEINSGQVVMKYAKITLELNKNMIVWEGEFNMLRKNY